LIDLKLDPDVLNYLSVLVPNQQEESFKLEDCGMVKNELDALMYTWYNYVELGAPRADNRVTASTWTAALLGIILLLSLS
jgi:hypothetical protein